MIGAEPLVSETALAAHKRRVAFRASIAEKAARLKERREGAHQPRDAAPEAVAAQTDPPAHDPAPVKSLWFSVESVSDAPAVSIREIQLAACREYGFSLTELVSQRRTSAIVRARQVAVYLCCALTPHSLPAIGRRFGGKDHTTMLHSQRRIAALILADQELAGVVAKLRTELGAAL